MISLLVPLVWLLGSYPPAQPQPVADDPVVAFIRANPERSAVMLVRNDTTLVSLRADQLFPLASTVKIMVAIEFAWQAAAGKIRADELVLLSDIDRYYLPNTDGGAQPAWKAELTARQAIQNGRVTLLDAAKGMIRYSSNANTEYLSDRLGFRAVNANRRSLKLPKHEPVLPMVAPLLLYSTTDKAATLARLRAMKSRDYEAQSMTLHAQLKADADSSLRKQFIFPDLELQKAWSDRLTASTAREYTSIMQKLNRRVYFEPAVQALLDQIMEWPFAVNPGNRQVYEHIGMKGGSTAFVLTNALYATDKAGNRSELVVFFNNLTPSENALLQKNLNTFLINCIQTRRYRPTVQALLR
ncbi:D-alanyl-D-alanine carboxypeptidase [Spirosoma lacussanchae]|uniref:serine hydrolase n=1 Tax=Spirosoma lacussanchae TaxID=1884249 RepID=UPI001486053D|nr:serine hydrolase [Spirosoma lacussanchae]